MLVAAHSNGLPELAAGMKALPDSRTSFAHTQALWRFLRNDKVTAQALAMPLMHGAREAIDSSCDNVVLIAHDWSRLNYNTHSAKTDRLKMTHATDVGYELQSSLAIADREGAPLAPVAQNLITGNKILSTYDPKPTPDDTHLDELSKRMAWLETQELGKPRVHIIDREADSVDHLRQWSKAGWRWLISS